MRGHSSIVQEMDRQGRYLHGILKTDKLNKLAWLELRHIVKVMGRLMVNLNDFNAVHFGPSSLRHRKRGRKRRSYKSRPSLEALWQKLR